MAKATTTDLCVMASALPPQEWSAEILWPLPKQPVSIFGYHHVAMDRGQSVSLVDALVWTEGCDSKGAARRMIQSNAVMVNRVKVKDVSRILTAADALKNLDAIVIEFGKHNFAIIELCGGCASAMDLQTNKQLPEATVNR
jgi:tyrosyl-tRNA synthetase